MPRPAPVDQGDSIVHVRNGRSASCSAAACRVARRLELADRVRVNLFEGRELLRRGLARGGDRASTSKAKPVSRRSSSRSSPGCRDSSSAPPGVKRNTARSVTRWVGPSVPRRGSPPPGRWTGSTFSGATADGHRCGSTTTRGRIRQTSAVARPPGRRRTEPFAAEIRLVFAFPAPSTCAGRRNWSVIDWRSAISIVST